MQALRIFCDVAELRSFSRAAARHGVTQSAVSQRVRQLEDELGVALVDRSVRPPVLTAAGELLAREGRALLDRYDRLRERVTRLHPEVRGEIRVDAIYSVGPAWLEERIGAFEQRWPGTRVVLELKRPEEVVSALRQGACELGIVSYPRAWGDLRVRPLREEPMVVVCRPDHPLAEHEQVEVRQLAGWPLLGFESSLPVARALRRHLRSNGVEPTFSQLVDNVDTLRSLLRLGQRAAVLPRPTVAADVESGLFVARPLVPALARPLGIIQAPQRSSSPAVEALVSFLLEHAEPQPNLEAVAATGPATAAPSPPEESR